MHLIRFSSLVATISVCAASLLTAATPASAQSLRGSESSVSLMYRSAVRGGLDFYETPSEVKRAVLRGELVSLRSNRNYVVSNVRTPYVRPQTKAFVASLAVDYRRACGQPMVVTSATRSMSRRLVNSSSQSVHPTGIAVDLRRPSGRCLTWLRRTLLVAERRGRIEATEERHPPHFHLAVLPVRYQKASTAIAARPSATTRSRGGR